VEVMAPSPVPLFAHALEGNGNADRPRRRFELFADLAEQTRLVVVRAPLSASPADLADAVIAAV
jgi:hypothetical protein